MMLHLPARKPVPEGYLFSNEALMALMVPLVIEQFLAAAVGMADTMMVSRAGEAAISGVSLVDMINKLIFQLLAALATGGAVVTSQFLGARARHKGVGFRRAAGAAQRPGGAPASCCSHWRWPIR